MTQRSVRMFGILLITSLFSILPVATSSTRAKSSTMNAELGSTLTTTSPMQVTSNSGFDGTFDGNVKNLTFSHNITYTTAPVNGISPKLLLSTTIPANAHDSFFLDVTIGRSQAFFGIYDWPALFVEVKPVTGTVWRESTNLTPSQLSDLQTSISRTARITVGHVSTDSNQIPANVPIEVRVHCISHPSFTFASNACQFGNFRFYDDAPGWARDDHGSNLLRPLWNDTEIGVINTTKGTIAPLSGNFFFADYARTSNDGFSYSGPSIEFPLFKSSTVITGTLNWIESGSVDLARQPVTIYVINNAGTWIPLASTGPRPANVSQSTWTTSAPISINSASISGLTGRVAIKFAGSASFTQDYIEQIGIDNLKVYANGRLIEFNSNDG